MLYDAVQVSRKLPKVSATSNSGERDGDSPTPLAAIYAAKKSSLLAQIHLLKEQQPYGGSTSLQLFYFYLQCFSLQACH